nr:putative ribonuclease H-like domain-containing protein [Tanacetum cinerariifolium]
MSSKAFKVFNKRTRRIEENLHVEFLENKAIVQGASPNWLFDIDSLTKSMNYMPVDAGTNSTNLSESPIPTVSSPVPTACLNDSSETSSEARLVSKRVVHQEESPSLDNILSLTNRFDDILGVPTSSDKITGVEADINNMETSISASPTPTHRIDKDHPKSQIIGPVDTLIQTRHKSKMVEE